MSSEDRLEPAEPSDREGTGDGGAVKWVLAALAVAGLVVLLLLPGLCAIPIFMFLTIVVPAVLTAVLVYGDPRQRSFAIGAMFPAGAMFWCTLSALVYYFDVKFESWGEFYDQLAYQHSSYPIYAGISWVLSVVLGVFTMGVRRALAR